MFDLERHMASVVVNNFDAIAHSFTPIPKNRVLAFEVPVRYRIIDVIMAYNPESLEHRKTELRPLRYVDQLTIEVLALFEAHSEVSLHRLRSELYITWDRAKATVGLLERKGLLSRVSEYKYVATGWKTLCPRSLISVELKLSDWRGALEQAKYNLSFSDYAFVAIDYDRWEASRGNIDVFRSSNVGLLGVESAGELRVLHMPSPNSTYSTRLRSSQKLRLLQALAQERSRIVCNDINVNC